MARSITLQTLAAPGSFAATPVVGGGTLPAGPYYYKIIALYGGASTPSAYSPIRSTPSAEIQATLVSTGHVDLSWDAVAGATGYMIWRTKDSGDYRHQRTPEGAHYKCKALRSSYSAYSATGTTYSDDGTISTTETTQATNGYLYLDFAVPRLDLSGGDAVDAFSMEYLYQQDVANAWGVITRSGNRLVGYTYEVKAHIKTTAAIYWVEEPYFNTWIMWSGFVSDQASTVMTIGCETSSEEWLEGVTMIFMGHDGYYAFGGVQFRNSTFYGVTLRFVSIAWEGYTVSIPYAGLYDMLSSQSKTGNPPGMLVSGGYTWKGCRVMGGSYQNEFDGGSAFVMEQCDFLRGQRTFKPVGDYSTGTLEDVRVKDESQCINCEHQTVTMRGGKVQGGGASIFIGYGDAALTLVGTEFDDDNIYWYLGKSVAPGARFYAKETVNIMVSDNAGNPLADALVTMADKDATVVFSESTDASGQIAEQEVTRLYATPADNTNHQITAGEKTDYNPFTITVSKAGYETLVMENLTISSAIDWQVELQDQVVYPSEADVEIGVQYGDGGAAYTGVLVLPASSDVRQAVGFGADGTEFAGVLALPGVSDVREEIGYGANGTELEGVMPTLLYPMTIEASAEALKVDVTIDQPAVALSVSNPSLSLEISQPALALTVSQPALCITVR